MKKVLFILFLCIPFLSFSQDRKDKKAQVEALKIQFITEELDLTDAEAEGFWPIFFQFEKEQKKIRKQIKNKRKEFEGETLSEDELRVKIEKIKLLENSLSERHEKFMLDCIPIIGTAKTQKLVTLEEKLRRKIGDKIRDQMKRE